MTVNFPPISPLRTQFPQDVRRPGTVTVYRKDKRGRLRPVQYVIPAKAIK